MPFDAQHKASHENQLETDKEKLFCAACGHLITFADQHIVMKGDHEHTVFNPAGIIFTIGCFQDAPGCLTTGQKVPNSAGFPAINGNLRTVRIVNAIWVGCFATHRKYQPIFLVSLETAYPKKLATNTLW